MFTAVSRCVLAAPYSLCPPVWLHLCLHAAQLMKLQADMEALREQRENTISTTREELYSAQEEVLQLQLTFVLDVHTSVPVVLGETNQKNP